MSKASTGNFFEDFRLGQLIEHATPRTITTGDVALYNGLFGPRFAVQSSDVFARAIGYPRAPVDDLLVFHMVFGKTVPDISLNAVANLGYAACRFLAPVYPGDTLHAISEVIGLKENSSRKTGIVFVRSTGCKQDGSKVLEYVRWVMLRKRDEAAQAPADHVPRLPEAVLPTTLGDACPPIEVAAYDFTLAGSPLPLRRLRGGREDRSRRRRHRGGGRAPDRDAALSEHRAHPFQPVRRSQGTVRTAPDLWRPCDLARARALVQRTGQCLPHRCDQWRPPRRRRCSPAAPCSPGRRCSPRPTCRDATMSARCRLRTVAAKDHPCADFPLKSGDEDHPAVLLDLDYWVLMPQ